MGFKKLKVLILVIAALLVLPTFSCNLKTYQKFEQTRELMGTLVSITVYSYDQQAAEGAMEAAFERMVEIESIANTYDPNSQISILNQDGHIKNPSPVLSELVTESKNYYQISQGAFDITVQPLLNLWASGLWQETEQVQQQKINQAMEMVGANYIIVEPDRIYFEKEGMEITLGGIAKGYAVDKAMEVLKSKGISYALVNAGGDIMTSGKKPDGSFWTIALENPDNKEESIEVLNVAGKAVTTSGNYERYFDPDKEAHHLIDPRSGFSANQCISATIISTSCMDADALSTSIFVLGPQQGIDLVNSLNGVEALIIDNDRNIFRSQGLSKYVNN
ncbi:MAG: FAD:protein FMN transferase [Actinomycetota bacterium]|nr:FAD:protein FMN transferase [Actinomycetota bacterium]